MRSSDSGVVLIRPIRALRQFGRFRCLADSARFRFGDSGAGDSDSVQGLSAFWGYGPNQCQNEGLMRWVFGGGAEQLDVGSTMIGSIWSRVLFKSLFTLDQQITFDT